MADNKYKIVAKEYSGIEVNKFVIERDDNKRKSISIEDTIRLARNNKLENAEAIYNSYTEDYTLCIDGGISNLPVKTTGEYVVSARIMEGSRCIAYRITDSNGKHFKLDLDKVFDEIANNSIQGLDAKIINGYKVISSLGTIELNKLPKITN